MKVTGIVPARFLTIISHFVMVIIIFWSRKPNIESCLPIDYTQAEYDQKDLEMIIGLSVALGLFVIEFIGFFGGLTMFTTLQCLLSISAHCSASVALAYYLRRVWPCYWYWYIFGFCTTSAHAVAFVALVFYIFEAWPCDWYWYIFGFCSALPGVSELFSMVSSLRRSY